MQNKDVNAAKAPSCQSGQTGYAVHPTYRKTLADIRCVALFTLPMKPTQEIKQV